MCEPARLKVATTACKIRPLVKGSMPQLLHRILPIPASDQSRAIDDPVSSMRRERERWVEIRT
jgi:hypothetical protein